MKLNDIPTPKTDKAEYDVHLGKHRRKVVRPELSRDLERRLEACRRTLEYVLVNHHEGAGEFETRIEETLEITKL